MKKRALQALFFFSLLLPLISDSFSFDRFYSIGWVALSLVTVFLIVFQTTFHWRACLIGIGLLIVTSIFAHLSNYHTDLASLSHVLIIVTLFSISPNFELDQARRLLFKPVASAFSIMCAVLIYILIQNYLTEGYSHQSTYNVAPFFAHRNIALEHVSLLALILLILSNSWKRVIWWFPFFIILVMFFQARAAVLLVALGILIWGVKNYPIKRVLAVMALVVFGYFTIAGVWSYVSFESYNAWFSGMPDIWKSIDPVYNLFYMSSSNERMKIWSWTWKELSFLPHGLGQWKILSQGWIILPNYDCLTVVRRPHNELLLALYEMGIIGGICFFGLLLYLKPSKYWLAVLPVLLFSFPLERASMIIPIWLLLSIRNKQVTGSIPLQAKWLTLSLLVFASLIHLGRWRADYLYANYVEDVTTVRELNIIDQQVLEIFPYDFMLNHHDKYKAFSAIEAGELNEALDLVWENYERNPNFYGNYIFLKQLAKDVNGQEIESNMKYSCEVEN